MFHQGALGDFLLALSGLEGWCASHPGLIVDFWSKREHVSLLSGKKYKGDFFPLDGPLIPSLLSDDAWETVSLPDFLLRADHVLIFGQDGTKVLAERLSTRLKGKVDWVRSFPAPDHRGTHVLDFVSEQLARLGLCGAGFPACPARCSGMVAISPPPSEVAAAKKLLDESGTARPVLIHPGSGGSKKVWPIANWRNLLHWMERDLAISAILSIGPADEKLMEFGREMGVAGVKVIGGLSLVRLSAVLSLCRLYIGSDSGVSHLAAAVGTPSVVIFGPTDPDVWGPRAEMVRIVKKEWSEAEVFEWNPKGQPGKPDPVVVEAVCELLRRNPAHSTSVQRGTED